MYEYTTTTKTMIMIVVVVMVVYDDNKGYNDLSDRNYDGVVIVRVLVVIFVSLLVMMSL